MGASATFPIGDGLRAGAYADYFFFWAELGAKLEHTLAGGFLVTEGWLGVEPGEFVPATAEVDPNLSFGLPRQPALRGVARGRMTLNLRTEGWWLYNRLTLTGRVRTTPELDPFRDAVLDAELALEEAFAPMRSLVRWGPERRRQLWVYAELSVEAEARAGLIDFRPSVGLIAEEIADGITLNLDIYRSFRDSPRLEGFGGLIFLWWSP